MARVHNPRVNLKLIEKRIKGIINREVLRLSEVSFERLLDKHESESLRAYAKLLPELIASHEADLEQFSDKELKKIIAAQKPSDPK